MPVWLVVWIDKRPGEWATTNPWWPSKQGRRETISMAIRAVNEMDIDSQIRRMHDEDPGPIEIVSYTAKPQDWNPFEFVEQRSWMRW